MQSITRGMAVAVLGLGLVAAGVRAEDKKKDPRVLNTKEKVGHGAVTALSVIAIKPAGAPANAAAKAAEAEAAKAAAAKAKAAALGAVGMNSSASALAGNASLTDPFGGKKVFPDNTGSFGWDFWNGFLNRLSGLGDFVTGGSAGKLGDNLGAAIEEDAKVPARPQHGGGYRAPGRPLGGGDYLGRNPRLVH